MSEIALLETIIRFRAVYPPLYSALTERSSSEGLVNVERVEANLVQFECDRSSSSHALELFPKRQRNVKAALEKIIECAGEVEVTAAAVVSAVTAYARINSQGQLIERAQTVNLNALFERMSTKELDKYARDGALPDWFESLVATGAHGRGVSNEE